MNPATLPGVLMGLLAALCLLIFLIGFQKAAIRSEGVRRGRRMTFAAVAIALAWVVLIGGLAQSGFFEDLTTLPPRPVLAMLLWLPVVIGFTYTSTFKRLALATPPQWLIYFQGFRIAVELLLFQAFVRRLMPVQMTFEGRNFDIVAGVLALVAGFVVAKRVRGRRTVAILYNVIGLILLVNVLTIALLSMPTPLRSFMNEPPVTVVGRFPFIYLPTVLVVFAYSFHVLSLRQLYLLRKEEAKSQDPVRPGEGKIIEVNRFTETTS
jgi:hypothetical protein